MWPPHGLPVAGRPIVNLSFALNYAMGRLDVTGYHVVNVLVHIACALMLFGIVRRTLLIRPAADPLRVRSADIAFASAVLWVLHPLNTEAVNYLTQRTARHRPRQIELNPGSEEARRNLANAIEDAQRAAVRR